MTTNNQGLFADMNTGAKVSLIAGVIIIFVAAIGFYLWVTRPRFEVVLHEVQREEIARAEQELSASQIAFKESEDGLSLLVAEVDAAQARIILADLGLPFEKTVGLEMFETSDFGVTEFAQQINYKRALEGELTRTISAMHEVRYARVHLVLPEKGLLKQDNVPASSAVTLFLRNGLSLNAEQVEGIQRLIVASVPELKIDNVTILDQRGNTLSVGSAKTPNQQVSTEQARIEDRLKEKIQAMLVQQFPVDQFKVTVNADINRQAVKRVEERPVANVDGKGALTHKTQSTEYSGENTKPTSRIEENYEYGVLREETEIPEGAINRLSVAVWLSAELSEAQQEALKGLIQTIVGANNQRGDEITLLVTEPLPAIVTTEPEAVAAPALPVHPTEVNDVVAEPVVTEISTFRAEVGGVTINLLYVLAGLLGCLLIAFGVIVKLMVDMRQMRLTREQRDVLLNQLNQILYEQKAG